MTATGSLGRQALDGAVKSGILSTFKVPTETGGSDPTVTNRVLGLNGQT